MAIETRVADLRGNRSASRRAGEVSERQFGAISRPQLLIAGFSSARIRSWLRAERLHPRYPGVYAYGRPDLPERGELAAGLLFAGGGSALGGLSALWWMELLGRRPDLIHLDAPGRRSSREDLRIRHPSPVERQLIRGLPVVALPRALLVASEALTHNSLRLVLARAEFRGVLELPSLQAALSESPRGAVPLRAAMDAHLPQLARCANGFERSFVLLCERFRLGRDAHSTPSQLAADARRQLHLESLGYTVHRYEPRQVELEPRTGGDRGREATGVDRQLAAGGGHGNSRTSIGAAGSRPLSALATPVTSPRS